MGYVDDDDPFYDHDEAMAAAVVSSSSSVARPHASQYAAARASAAVRASQFGRPTLNRSASGGRTTTATFDEFLSDSDDSDDDDGSAIHRMQEQADDMEYIDTSFQLDSPNARGNGNGDDHSFRMDAPPPVVVASSRDAPTVVNVLVNEDSDSGGDDEGDDEGDDVDNSITRPFADHDDSFVGMRRREASSPDALDSSFSLLSPSTAIAGMAGGNLQQHADTEKLSMSDDGKPSGEFSPDTSFVLNSPNANGGYLDDSFTGDRPSNLDQDYSERLDDSFIANRPSQDDYTRTSLDDSFASDRPSNLDADYERTSLDDSFVSDRPSNLDADYGEDPNNSFASDRPSNLDANYDRTSLDDSFASDRPSNLDADYDRTSLDDSFASDRPSNLDVDYNETLDDSFTGDRPSFLDAGSDEPGSSEWENATVPVPITTSVATATVSVNDAVVPVASVAIVAAVSQDTDVKDNLVEPKLSLTKRESSESVDNKFARESLVYSVQGDVDNSTADEDVSFRMSISADLYSEYDNDSFVAEEPPTVVDNELVVTSSSTPSSFENASNSSGFFDVSRAFEQEDYGDAASLRQSKRGDVEDLYSRESTGSAASLSASSFDNQQSFFVGSMGSEADALSYLPLSSSPAFSDVVMLGDENDTTGKSRESGSLDLQSLAARDSENGNVSAFSPHDPPPVLPVSIRASSTRASAASVSQPAATFETAPRASSRLPSQSLAAPRSSFVNANESLAVSPRSVARDSMAQAFSFSRDSAASATLNNSFMRDSNLSEVDGGFPAAGDSFTEDNTFRLSSPNARASEMRYEQDSFSSETPLGDSFSSVSYSEVAARRSETSASGHNRDSEHKHDVGQVQAPVSSSPTNPLSLASRSPAEAGLQAERQTDELLDFTGVYRDSVKSSDHVRVSQVSRNTVVRLEDKVQESSLRMTATPVSLTRGRGESIHQASERRVEDFFRRTYNFNEDDDDLNIRETTRMTRARTTVEFSVHEEEEGEQQHQKQQSLLINMLPPQQYKPLIMTDVARQRSKSTGTKKTIDMRKLRMGPSAAIGLAGAGIGAATGFVPTRSRAVSRPSTRLLIKEDLLEVAPSERRSRLTFRSSGESGSSVDTIEAHALEEKAHELQASRIHQNSTTANETSSNRVIQRNFTLSISSETPSSNLDDSPNMIPMPPHYMLSPKTESPVRADSTSAFGFSKRVGKSKSKKAKAKDIAGVSNGNDSSMTPTLSGFAMASSSLTPSPFSASYAAAASSKMPLPHSAQTDMAPGFKWNAQEQFEDESGGTGMKESIWHEAGITRPTLSDQVATQFQRFSLSLRNTLQRTGVRFFGQQQRGAADPNQPTSPQSICSAPPQLSRKFDDKNFYVRFGRGGGVEDNDEVIAAKQALGRNLNRDNVFKKRKAHTMVILLCALLGIGLGIGLIHIESLSASFNLPREEQLLQQQLQAVIGGLKVATATQWILLPGRLFLRLWNCVTMPLLFCHILNGIADLAMNRKAGLVLSFRSLGYMLCFSLITTLEGVGMMAGIKTLGLFKSSTTASNMNTKVTAAALRRTLGVIDRRNGTVALMCEADRSYLQSTNGGQTFQCSNASISLPVYDEKIVNGTKFDNPAVFVFSDVNNVLEASATGLQTQLRYYPQSQSLNTIGKQLVNSVVPVNVADSLISSTPMSTVAIALVLGLVCGKRAWERGIHAKHGNFADSRIELAGEHVADKPHYILGVFVELQLALEWLVDVLETLAPVGVLFLLTGSIVLHRQELMTVVDPMMQLVLGVIIVCMVHVLVVVPLLMRVCFKVNTFASYTAFLPAYLMCFCTGSVVLSLPVVQQCYERGNVVTKSMAQVAMGMLSVLHRNAHALYYPVAILWLLQTSSQAGDVELTTKLCVTVGMLTLASCFFALHPVASVVSGTHSGSNLVVIMTLWRALLTFSESPGATSTPPTFPLLVACDVLLARFVAMVNLHDNMVVSRMIAEHCDEAVVVGAVRQAGNSVDLAPSPMYI